MDPKRTLCLRTFELDVPLTGAVVGTFDDWPANIQDAIMTALERTSHREKLPLAIVHSRCDVDYDVPEGAPGRYFIYVLASEIVVADERFLSPGTVARELPADMKKYFQ